MEHPILSKLQSPLELHEMSVADLDQTAAEIVALVADQTIAPSTFDMEDNEKILIGTGDDLQIYHDGSNSHIHDSGSGVVYLRTNKISYPQKNYDEN